MRHRTEGIPEQPRRGGPRGTGGGSGQHDRVSLHATFAAFRSVPYRWLWSATLASTSGRWSVLMVGGWLAYRLTGSAAGSGLILLLAFIPALLVGPVSGALADQVDRRRLIQGGDALAAAICLVAAAFAATGRLPFGLVLLVALAAGVAVTLEQPSRISLVSVVSAPEDLLNAFSLIRIPTQGAEMVGPAVATVVLLGLGPAAALALCGVFYLLAALQVMRIVLPPPRTEVTRRAAAGVVQSVAQAVGYARRERPLGSLLVWVGLH